mgnify:CR=1 FL=1
MRPAWAAKAVSDGDHDRQEQRQQHGLQGEEDQVLDDPGQLAVSGYLEKNAKDDPTLTKTASGSAVLVLGSAEDSHWPCFSRR